MTRCSKCIPRWKWCHSCRPVRRNPASFVFVLAAVLAAFNHTNIQRDISLPRYTRTSKAHVVWRTQAYLVYTWWLLWSWPFSCRGSHQAPHLWGTQSMMCIAEIQLSNVLSYTLQTKSCGQFSRCHCASARFSTYFHIFTVTRWNCQTSS